MSMEQIATIETFIKCGISPILLEEYSFKDFKNAVILNSNCNKNILNGHYEGATFVAPKWYEKLKQNSKNKKCLLVIENINKVPKKEQVKFLEILKYNKIGVFELPKNCIIIVTTSGLKENEIDESIYSLFAHI